MIDLCHQSLAVVTGICYGAIISWLAAPGVVVTTFSDDKVSIATALG